MIFGSQILQLLIIIYIDLNEIYKIIFNFIKYFKNELKKNLFIENQTNFSIGLCTKLTPSNTKSIQSKLPRYDL